MERRKTAVAAILLLALLSLCIALGMNMPGKVQGEGARVIFIGTQEDADSILLRHKGSAVLIDTGEEQDAPAILARLEQEGVSKLDALILSHPDKDHIGGAAAVLDAVTVDRVVQSFFDKGSALQDNLDAKIEGLGIPVTIPAGMETYRCGDIQLFVYPPQKGSYKQDNNYSLVVWAVHNKVNMLFPGDAEKKRLEELLPMRFPKMDIYKAPHHGRLNSLSVAMAEAVNPKYAVVTAGKADPELEKAFEGMGTEIFYTVPNTVVFLSDGETARPE